MRYSAERKEAVLRKMLPPNNKSLKDLAQEEGISEATLHLWRRETRAQGRLLPDADKTPEGWSAKDKFCAVVETAAMNEEELSEYCRKRGLYPEQMKGWRIACEQATDRERESSSRLNEVIREERKRNKELERELTRKEKALAEAAALLILRKKAEVIWGEYEDA
ncbi:putative IS3 family mobile element-associated protein [Gammaproteobacteria bacterium]